MGCAPYAVHTPVRGVHLSSSMCCLGAGASKRCAHHWGTQVVTGATGVGTRDTTHGVTMGAHCPHHTYLVCVPEDSGRRLAQHPDGKWFGTASTRLLLYGQGSFCTRSPSPAFIQNQHEGSWSTLLHQNPSPATWAVLTLTRRRFVSKSMPSDSSLRKGRKKKWSITAPRTHCQSPCRGHGAAGTSSTWLHSAAASSTSRS